VSVRPGGRRGVRTSRARHRRVFATGIPARVVPRDDVRITQEGLDSARDRLAAIRRETALPTGRSCGAYDDAL